MIFILNFSSPTIFTEAATQDILAQDRERQHNHDEVVEDLASMQQKAKDAWLKVGE